MDTSFWLPIVVACAISLVTSTGGVSGAVLILPFQVSVLGLQGPTVSATNLLFNVVAIPAGVYRFHREGRMVWPLAWMIVLAGLPAMFLGAWVRVTWLQDARAFKLFAACVLLYLGVRLVLDSLTRRSPSHNAGRGCERRVTTKPWSFRRIEFEFDGVAHGIDGWKVLLLSGVVGVVGGAYGVGGGAFIAPFLLAQFRLPAHSIAGACLFGTFASSIAGVLFYAALDPFHGGESLTIAPDWSLGLRFGVGGAVGIYLGARLQRHMPERVIKPVLAAVLFCIVVRYAVEFLS